MSINYYNNNAKDFINNTFHVSMEALIREFLFFVPDGGKILDLGCGSGRDSLYFMNNGYDIFAIDGSEEMVAHTKKYIGDRVQLATFESYNTEQTFDGIWALASLLHVDRENIEGIIRKYSSLLNDKGVFFMSFKNREEDYRKDGRFFTCFTEDGLVGLIGDIQDIELVKVMHTVDVREDRPDEKWISVIVRRKG